MRIDLDFSNGHPSLRGWRLAVLVAGAVSLIAAASFWYVQYSAYASLEHRWSRAMMSVRTERETSASRAVASTPPAAEMASIARAAGQINAPLLSLMKAVVPPADVRVALLDLDLADKVDAATRDARIVKIIGEAKTFKDMTDYVAFLAERPVLQTVYLLKHETDVLSPQRPIRFQLEARWKQ